MAKAQGGGLLGMMAGAFDLDIGGALEKLQGASEAAEAHFAALVAGQARTNALLAEILITMKGQADERDDKDGAGD